VWIADSIGCFINVTCNQGAGYLAPRSGGIPLSKAWLRRLRGFRCFLRRPDDRAFVFFVILVAEALVLVARIYW